MTLRKLLHLIIFLLIRTATIQSQDISLNHPELKWFTIETGRFEVHYHDGAERTASIVATIAEEIYGPLTSLYQYEPDGKIHFIIRDHDDFSNGAAYYYDNKVEIWASPMDFIFRGTHNWLRNVVTHEFSHMISLGAARKMPRTIPALYFQYLGYEPEKNPYVLYGFPNHILSYPIAGTIIPMWLAEGVAQFQLPGLNYDTWDTHRDMILRTSALEGQLLDFKEIGVFGETSLRNEKVYNHGYSITQFIVDRYGVESLRNIIHEMKKPWRLTIDGALKKVLRLNEKQLHQEWKSHLEKIYAFRTSVIKDNLVTGEIVQDEGSANIFPQWSPDGTKYAFLSNRGERSIYKTSLYIHDVQTKKTDKLKDHVLYSPSWSPDGNQIAYSKKSKPTKYFSHYIDIYTYDFPDKKEVQITDNLRASSPDWSPDGKRLVFVTTGDGTQNIAVANIDSKEVSYLTKFEHGEEIFGPQWSADGRSILFSISRRNNRDIVRLNLEDGSIDELLSDEADARDPVYSQDGQNIYFSYDDSGIYNVYSMDANGGSVKQLSNVLGGAFMPSIDTGGQLLFSLFQSQQYNIAKLDQPEALDSMKTEYVEFENNFHLASADVADLLPLIQNETEMPKIDSDDWEIPEYASEPYEQSYQKMTFMPRLMIDYGTTKLGTYFYSSDVLNKYSILGGVAINKDLDYDLFGIVEYNRFLPTIFLEAYYQVRNHSQKDSLIIRDEFIDYREFTDFSYKYNLLEVDLGLKSYVFNELSSLRLAFIFSRYDAKVKYSIQGQKVSFPYTYFIGRNLSLTYTFSNFVITPYFDSEISPSGKRKVSLSVEQEFNRFLDDFKLTEYMTWSEVYDKYDYTKLGLDWQEFIGLFDEGKHTLNLHLQGGAILKPVHEFFNYFAGGLVGLRGYPYYSIEGRKQLIARFTYRFPVFDALNFRLLHLYFDKLYAGVFYDMGNAFNEDRIHLSDFKKDYGFELRLDLFSFYSFPTRIFFNAAYGIDDFIKEDRYSDLQLKYGKEWRYYLGVTFGYFN